MATIKNSLESKFGDDVSPEAFDAMTELGQVRYLAARALLNLPDGDEVDQARRCLNQIGDMLEGEERLPTHRIDLAFDATAEIECLIARLRSDIEGLDEIDHALQTQMISAVKSIRRLNSVAMSVCTPEENREYREMYLEVHGQPPVEEVEAANV